MGQIVRRRKKGRPAKASSAHRFGESPATPQSDLRRSLRRRNVRYNIEYDDYLDEDDEDEDEDERRREKKLKLVVKLNQDRDRDEDESAPSRTRGGARGGHSRDSSEEDEGERKPLKKRKIGGGRVGNEDGEEEEEEEGGDDNDEDNENEEDENVRDLNDDDDDGVVKGRKVDSKGLHSVSGTPRKSSSGIRLPDKRTLELILDKLQKKDTYGVYAEPVDPEELPDYHDVIEHPMDFATVRKKLANGSYPTLEQFENDVFLICTNAMQYNSPETIYHKQARSIQELARKKFEKLRIDFENSQSEQKSDQKARSNSLGKKQTKKPVGHASQEPVCSDFSAGATLANIGDVLPTSHPIPGGSCERPCNNDGLADVNGFFTDAILDKAEDFSSGKSLLSKLGRKPFALDDNRRGSYNASIQPVAKSDSVLMTFESEIKQLVTVGLHAEYSYSRSLARFAATLGPVAWRIASRRIQHALPSGCKFGRGWVGEYEPLPRPVIMLDNRTHKESSFVPKFQSTESGKGDKNGKTSESSVDNNAHRLMKQPSIDPASRPASEGKPSLFGSAGIRPTAPGNALCQQQIVQPRSSGKPENKGMKQVELNSLPSMNQNNANLRAKFLGNASPGGASKPREMAPRNMNILPSVPFKEPDTNGAASGDLPNGKVTNSSLNRRATGPPSESTSNQTGRAGPFVPHGQDQSLTDPVQLMRMLAEKAQKQQASSNPSPVDTPPMTPSVSSGRRDDLGNAAAAAARAWMSVGAGGFKQGADNSSSPKNQISADSLYNPSREYHQHIPRTRGEIPSGGMPFQPEKNNFPFQALASQPIHPGSVSQSQFPNRPVVFPQLAAADLSGSQMQSAWQGLSPHGQPRQKPETLPPDLNIGFQSPGSPAKQPSGAMVDSQQPDLALQL